MLLISKKITFSPEDVLSIKASAEKHEVIKLLLSSMGEIETPFLKTVELSVPAIYYLFIESEKAGFLDESGIINHILFELGFQHPDDMKDALLTELKKAKFDADGMLASNFLHFCIGQHDKAYILSAINKTFP
jgi:hypothetical protein